MMFEKGDRVRVDLPDNSNSKVNLHRKSGTVKSVIEDASDDSTKGTDDRFVYRVELDNCMCREFRSRDLTPITEDSGQQTQTPSQDAQRSRSG